MGFHDKQLRKKIAARLKTVSLLLQFRKHWNIFYEGKRWRSKQYTRKQQELLLNMKTLEKA